LTYILADNRGFILINVDHLGKEVIQNAAATEHRTRRKASLSTYPEAKTSPGRWDHCGEAHVAGRRPRTIPMWGWPMKKAQRELFQYDGHRFIGRIIVDPDGDAKAFNGGHKRLGTFPDFRAAMAAISAAHMSAMSPTVGRNAKRARKLLSWSSAHG
jgi:hypothetical protein